MSELTKYSLYFILGGLLVSISTYLGAHGKGFFAALASTVPVISGMTFILVYVNAGQEPTLSFAKHLIYLIPAMVRLCRNNDCECLPIRVLVFFCVGDDTVYGVRRYYER